MSTDLPVLALTGLGALIVILALFTGGGIELLVVGLVTIAVAGLLSVLGGRRRL